MKLTRREALLAGAGAALAGCTPALREVRKLRQEQPVQIPKSGTELIVRRLNRLGYGPRPQDIERVGQLGWDAYVDEQLNASRSEPEEIQTILLRLDIFNFGAIDLRAIPEHEIVRQLQQAAIVRAVYSPNQLRERMVEFWSDHFNIDSKKAYAAFFLSSDQKSVIRENVLGKVPAMLAASAHSPAMLGYLDNKVSTKGVVNENYGREILELHSLGVNSSYTQQDVREVARCFTGWGVENRFLRAGGSFAYDDELHDQGSKTVLGHKIPAEQGQKDGDQVLEIIGRHPDTAHHIATKLAKAFYGDEYEKWVQPNAEIYLKTDGDIKAMLRPMLTSNEFGHSGRIAKRPFDFLVSAIRSVDGITDGSHGIQELLADMGQPLYQWAMPDGYPTKTSAWTASMLGRWNFALALAYGSANGIEIDLPQLAKRFSLAPSKAVTMATLGSSIADATIDPRKLLAQILSGPEFQWR